MKNGYVKLFSDIVASSIWVEPDPVRIVWITMLALADRRGVVGGSIPGLANIARVELSDCQRALEVLSGPDEFSRNGDNDGRRIEKCDRGWRILNYEGFRERLSEEDRREYKAKWIREKRKANNENRREAGPV